MGISLFYDLHMHSCLSPCGDADMTPGNMANMAALCGLQVVALSDHNSCENCAAFLSAARDAGLVALPAMELTTSEEVHILCLLPTLEAAQRLSDHVFAHLPDLPNDEVIFGPQICIDTHDREIGRISRLLTSATDIGIYDVASLVASYGGLAMPAHIDRPSFSLLANLGFYDPDMGFPVMELSLHADEQALRQCHPELAGVTFIRNSDAHYLQHIQDAARQIFVDDATPQAVLQAFMAM